MSDTIMMGRPVIPTEEEAEAGRRAGIDISDPYDNSVMEPCTGCVRDVWIGPLQQKQRRDLNGHVTVFCPTCAVNYVATHADTSEPMNIVNLGNEHPRGN